SRSWFWALLAVLLVFSAIGSFKRFTRFRSCLTQQFGLPAPHQPTDSGRLPMAPETQHFDHI
ncbi:MAG: hypothetical protein ACYS29_10425, partial [Planctomycetota bacterium]